MISAKIIADSISPNGVRLTTMECTFHRFILAEMNTHRMFSRNSASSRAIPTAKMRKSVFNEPAIPVHWGRNQSGMQADEELTDESLRIVQRMWTEHRNRSLAVHCLLEDNHLHKQIANRILEPFMWHTAIITATEWDNFFHQRCHPDAQPEMKAIADQMQIAYYTNTPKLVEYGQWHLPYITEDDLAADPHDKFGIHNFPEDALKVSVARCARVSYLTQDGKRDIEKDLELYERLTQGGHWSPFEHVASPITKEELDEQYGRDDVDPGKFYSGNFRGWTQYRKLFENENRQNFVPNHPDVLAFYEKNTREFLEQAGVTKKDLKENTIELHEQALKSKEDAIVKEPEHLTGGPSNNGQ